MALTVSNLVSDLAVAASTPAIESSAAVKVLTATTVSLTLFGKVSSVGTQASSASIILWYAIVPYDGTSGITKQVASCAKPIRLKWSPLPTQAAVTSSVSIPTRAGFLHYWLEIPTLPFAATVTVDLVESTVTLVDSMLDI